MAVSRRSPHEGVSLGSSQDSEMTPRATSATRSGPTPNALRRNGSARTLHRPLALFLPLRRGLPSISEHFWGKCAAKTPSCEFARQPKPVRSAPLQAVEPRTDPCRRSTVFSPDPKIMLRIVNKTLSMIKYALSCRKKVIF